MTTTPVTGRTRNLVIAIDKLVLAFSRHWLLVVNVMARLFIGLTAAAPLLMALGLEGPARVLYRFYALNCHQLPQRSYFLFGPHGVDTYPLEQILAWGGRPLESVRGDEGRHPPEAEHRGIERTNQATARPSPCPTTGARW